MYTLEICAVGLNNALIAQRQGAHRIELCENLESGGLTPSHGTLSLAAEMTDIPLHVLIRPRRGNYVYDKNERNIMLRDIKIVRSMGFAGVVIGALLSDGTLDNEITKALKNAAEEMSVTFHRAIDVCTRPEAAIETLVALGVERLLTSGGAHKATQGASQIAIWQANYGSSIKIMAGSGIRSHNALDIITMTGVNEIHASAKSIIRSHEHHYSHSSSQQIDDWWYLGMDGAEVKKLRQIIDVLNTTEKELDE